MLTVSENLVLPTTVTGSLPRPGWHRENLESRAYSEKRWMLEFEEQYQDALSCYMNEQWRAGLDIFVDGDCRFDRDVGGRSWIAYPLERLAGLEGRSGHTKFASLLDLPVTNLLRKLQAGAQWPAVTGELGPGSLEYVNLWKLAQAATDQPVKFGAISAQCLERFLENRYYADDVEMLFALCDALNAEYRALAAAGCPIIQIEEPVIHFLAADPSADPKILEMYVEAFNREVRGVEAEIWYHSCWGNPAQQRVTEKVESYERGLEWMIQCDCDVITLETASTKGMDFPLLQNLPTDKKFGLGVIDHHSMQIESAAEVAALIRKALQFLPPERIILTSDCGFGREGLPRRVAFHKMISLVEGANIVREELGLPVADVPAANPAVVI